MAEPTVRALLTAAVDALGGVERPGQVAMAEAVADAMETGEHLLVQAGTGTGKSLAYLVPALLHANSGAGPVVVATATLALQAQVVDRDLPRLLDAAEPLLGRRPTYAMLKGRRNYLCKHKLYGGMPPEEGEALFTPTPTTPLGRDLLRVRKWAETTQLGDRDELVPGVSDRAWAQVSVSARECLGAARCPQGADCFAELARRAAAEADVVVTNHALLAIDALEGIPVLPEHDVVIVDEGHDLVDRVTSVAAAELTPGAVERAAARCRRLLPQDEVAGLDDAADALADALGAAPEGRLVDLPARLLAALTTVRDAARAAQSGVTREKDADEAIRRTARAALDPVFETASRVAAPAEHDVVWVTRSERWGPALHVAPLSVAALLRGSLFSAATVVMTSATLALGGSFDVVASAVGLAGSSLPWRGLDVGSPFDYRRQAILYVARHLPPPGRDGASTASLDELTGLVRAAGGRTLGLFSSMRAAETAAAVVRERLDVPVLCQGEDATAELVRRFASSASTCLFGTLSLWQGVDVPGSALQLVVIDRIPFPRPDDPLMSARKDAAGDAGFKVVYAAHAALRLAQGAGRLIRSSADRGVVAVLDPRLHTARYGAWMRASLPDFWYTTDAHLVRRSLASIDAAAPAVAAVGKRVARPVVRRSRRGASAVTPAEADATNGEASSAIGVISGSESSTGAFRGAALSGELPL